MRHPRRQGAHGHEARNNETSRPSSGSRTATRNHPPSPRGRDEELKICGGHGPGETPGPIPNPEAKAWHGDGTAPERMWESSTPPHSPYERGPHTGSPFLRFAHQTRPRPDATTPETLPAYRHRPPTHTSIRFHEVGRRVSGAHGNHGVEGPISVFGSSDEPSAYMLDTFAQIGQATPGTRHSVPGILFGHRVELRDLHGIQVHKHR